MTMAPSGQQAALQTPSPAIRQNTRSNKSQRRAISLEPFINLLPMMPGNTSCLTGTGGAVRTLGVGIYQL